MSERRPAPASFAAGDAPSETEFRRWYWTVSDLRQIAKALGVATSGPKLALTERIAARLAGRPAPAAPRRGSRNRVPAPLSARSVIPPEVILDRALQDWFREQLGPAFRIDEHLRRFLRDGSGSTLGDALEHWHATRDAARPAIAAQFQYNRFVREWRATHPGAAHDDVVRAWHAARAQPSDGSGALGP